MRTVTLIEEKDLREAIRKLLFEQSGPFATAAYAAQYDFYKEKEKEAQQKLAATKESILGKKFAYEEKAPTEGRVCAKMSNGSFVAKVYSKATIKDPIARSKGRLLTDDELIDFYDGNWQVREWFNERISPLIQEVVDQNAKTNRKKIPEILYKEHGLFVLTVNPERPEYASTEAAVDAAAEGRCSFSIRDFSKEMGRIRTISDPEDREQQILRVMACAKGWTFDSFAYAIFQFVVSSLAGVVASALATPAAGVAASVVVDTAMDMIPGYFLCGMYAAAGKRQTAVELGIVTTINMLSPSIISKLTKTSWKMLVASLGVGVFTLIINKVTKTMFGEDFGFTTDEIKSWIDSNPDGTVDQLKSRFGKDILQMKEPIDFMRKLYPPI